MFKIFVHNIYVRKLHKFMHVSPSAGIGRQDKLKIY